MSRCEALQHSLVRAVLAQLVCAALIGIAALWFPLAAEPAHADTQDGLWYYDDFGIEALHEAGYRGQGVTVALFDSPINIKAPDLVGQHIEPRTGEICAGYDGVEDGEKAEHGTGMASLIVGNGEGVGSGLSERGVKGLVPDARLLHYAVIETPKNCRPSLTEAVEDALAQGATILSFSIGWGSIRDIEKAFSLALAKGAIIDVAVQNEDGDESDPISGANGVVSIENVDPDGKDDGMTVTSPRLDFVAPGVDIRAAAATGHDAWQSYGLSLGTSPATAWTSGVFALASSAWPDATPNQLLQSAIRTTSNEGWKPLERTNEEGFGLLSPQNLVAINPTGFPDENPLIRDSDDGKTDLVPTPADIFGSGGRGSTDPGIETVDHELGSSTPVDKPNRTAEEVGALPTVDEQHPAPEVAPSSGDLAVRALGEVLLVAAVVLLAILIIATIARKRRKPAYAPAAWGAVPYGSGGYGLAGYGSVGYGSAGYGPAGYGPAGSASQLPGTPAPYGANPYSRAATISPYGMNAPRAAAYGVSSYGTPTYGAPASVPAVAGGSPAVPSPDRWGAQAPLPNDATSAAAGASRHGAPQAGTSQAGASQPGGPRPAPDMNLGYRSPATSGYPAQAPLSTSLPAPQGAVPSYGQHPVPQYRQPAGLSASRPSAPSMGTPPAPPQQRLGGTAPGANSSQQPATPPRPQPRYEATKPYELGSDFWPSQVIKAKNVEEYQAPQRMSDPDSKN